jgi:hypothetical protein
MNKTTKSISNARGVNQKRIYQMTTLVHHKTVYSDIEIEVDSPQWLEWLKNNSSFRYQCELGNITLIKDGLYWTAAKKVDGRLRRKRAGKDSELTKDKLWALTALLCVKKIYTDYLREKGDRQRSTKKGLEQKIEDLEKKLADREEIIAALKEKLLSVSRKGL